MTFAADKHFSLEYMAFAAVKHFLLEYIIFTASLMLGNLEGAQLDPAGLKTRVSDPHIPEY